MGVKTRHAPGIHPPLVVLFSVVFPGEKSWLEQGWLVALVMMSMLPFMGIGAAPWNEGNRGWFLNFVGDFWAIFGNFCGCWGSFRFVCWLVPFKGRIHLRTFLGDDFLMRKKSWNSPS